MATASTNIATSPLSGFSGIFRAIGAGIVAIAESNTRVRQVQALSAMSDEQLKARGIRREDIVRYVFADSLYI